MIEEKRYDVFHRTWWRRGEHGGRVPGAGKRTYLAHGLSYELAQEVAQEYNDSHEPGPLSRKAEFEEA